MIRRLPVDAPVRKPDGDADLLRLVASAANEIVDVVSHLPAAKVGGGARHVVAALCAGCLRITTPLDRRGACRTRATCCARAAASRLRPLGEPDEPPNAERDGEEAPSLRASRAEAAASAVPGPELHREQRG